MKNLILICLFALLPLSANSYHVTFNPNRTIEIKDTIRSMKDVEEKILKLSLESSDPIYLDIDSPGGSVLEGLRVIRAIEKAQYRGVPIICTVDGMAASMAMHILGSCSQRYAYRTSILMWHPASIGIMARVTEEDAHRLATQLKLLTHYLDEKLRLSLRLSKETYMFYYRGEYLILAYDLDRSISPKFLTLIEDVK